MISDAELLRRYVEDHSEPAFAELVQRHLGVVYNAALRRVHGNAHLAEEAAQLVFTDLARKARRLAGHPALLGWLHTSTRYGAAVLLRREQRRLARERTALTMDSAPCAPEPAVPWENLRPLIDEALDGLAAEDRHAVLLRFFAGRSFAEVGAELGVSEEASRKRVTRALERLRERLAQRGIATTGAALALALSTAPAIAVPASLTGTVTSGAVAAAMTAGAAGGSLAGVLGFMSTIKISGISLATCSLVGLTTFGAATLAFWAAQQNAEREQLAALDTQVAAIHARLAQWERDATARARATPPAAASAPTATPAASSAAAADRQASESLRHAHLLATSPEFAPFRQQELRLRVQREFGPFFAERGYPPDKIETLCKALVLLFDAEETNRRERQAAPAGTTTRNRPLIEETRAVLAHMESYLGADETAKIQRYFVARQELPNARQAGYDLADAGLPLTPEQQQSLASVLAETSTSHPEGRALSRKIDSATGLSPAQKERLKRAAAFLSPEQLRQFETFQRDEAERARLMARASGL